MKKRIKLLSMILALTAMIALTATTALADDDGSVTATPSTSRILVNGNKTAFTAYTINQSNYFKLRDIAMIFNGTAKTFSVDWDGGLNEIDLTTGAAYKPVGGEMAPPPSSASGVKATPTTSSIVINGWESVVMAYTIGGNNFFRLRDLAAVLNFSLTWSGSTNTISIETSSGYDSPENSLAGGPLAELIGAWTGPVNGKPWTVYFFWNGTFEEGTGDPSTGDYRMADYGSYEVGGGKLTTQTDYGRKTFTYSVSRMDDAVVIDLSQPGTSLTFFKH